MAVRIATGLSTLPDPVEAGREAAESAGEQLDGESAELAFVFASGAHLAAPEAMIDGIQEALAPAALVGCGAGGVLGSGRELESGTGIAVWAASFAGAGEIAPFHTRLESEAGEARIAGLPALEGAQAAVLLPDPYTFPTDAVLSALAMGAPGLPVLGGLASARGPTGSAALILDDNVCEEGAVGVCFRGVELLPCVSQGAVPVGPEVTVTGAEGNVIHELAGRPALETVERLIAELPPRERALVAGGLLIGIVVDGGKPEYQQGDFLVRGVIAADTESGRLTVGALVHPGQVIRLHARDARSADEDLRRALRLRMDALGGSGPAGALVFSCNGRGSAMFGSCNHDAEAVQQELGGAPAAGFFAAGEIGPVGGRSFLHGFTATVAVFPS
ncbi:MAG: FIST C-terminal domain-containing protein [Solirubrobacterales bacterium]|nr:FIST C-terminal domain-containing protein [Solirubrobacterales bacterium]MBV9166475.1 FIST C-terminal domain-containing protein [Solirubrobacterales bacterium]